VVVLLALLSPLPQEFEVFVEDADQDIPNFDWLLLLLVLRGEIFVGGVS
jgi:hypothetical protein